MTFPVLIQFSGHKLQAQMHVVPRAGDRIRCSFPAAGIEKRLFLKVREVIFHQPDVGLKDAECQDPFHVIITTKDDPNTQLRNANAAVFDELARGATGA